MQLLRLLYHLLLRHSSSSFFRQPVVTVGTNGPGSHSKCQLKWSNLAPEACGELHGSLGTRGPEPDGRTRTLSQAPGPCNGCFRFACAVWLTRFYCPLRGSDGRSHSNCFVKVALVRMASHESLCFLAQSASRRRCGEPCLRDGCGLHSGASYTAQVLLCSLG